MRIYLFLWSVSAAVATGGAAAVVVGSGEWLAVVAVALALAAFAGIMVLAFLEDRTDRWRWTARTALGTVGVCLATGGLGTAWGRAGSLVAVGLVVTCPFLITWTRRQVGAWRSHRVTGPPESLGRRELLRRWEWTTGEVLRSSTPLERRLVLVEERRRLLDELEQRDPVHFADWVVSAVPDRAPPRQRHRRA